MLETPAEEVRPRNLLAVALPRLHVDTDIRLIVGGAVILAFLLVLGDRLPFLEPVRLLLALIYVLYIPGYCLTGALFSRSDDLDVVERSGLSIALSVAVVPLVALTLSVLPWGLRPATILVGQVVVSVLLASISSWRRSRLPAEIRYRPIAWEWHPGSWWTVARSADRRVVVLFVVITLVIGATMVILAVPPPTSYTTEFYLLGAGGSADGFPVSVRPNDLVTVTAGIVNRERDARTYRVEAWVNDGWNPSHRSLVFQSGAISLSPGQVRQMALSWRMPWAGDDQEVDILLFVDGHSESYRRLRMWMNVGGDGTSRPADASLVSPPQATLRAPP